MSNELPDLHHLNKTELLAIIRRQTGMVVRRSVETERLIEMIEDGVPPTVQEIADTSQSRLRLQTYVEKNWGGINSQIPCKGENRGRCTIYPCPEGRHLDCFLAARAQLRVHDL